MSVERCKEKLLLRPVDRQTVARLAAELEISETLARVLVGRGLTTYNECKTFFNPAIDDLHDPFCFSDMNKAIDVIVDAIECGKKIVVYGDYDVDGVTGTALLIGILRKCGAVCDYYLPNRLTEGYGVSKNGIDAIASSGGRVMITVDCGIGAAEAIDYAASQGITTIVTDHHEPKEVRPNAYAVINPRCDPGYPPEPLAGVGVALKCAHALCIRLRKDESWWGEMLDLAALGTAADIVPLTGENRIITSVGFETIAHSTRAGIQALLEVQGLSGKKISTGNVVFGLAPCINAVGRLGDPRRGVELLITDDYPAAMQYARELQEANLERRAIDSSVEAAAIEWVETNWNPLTDYGIVAGDPNWHRGVIGIVASKCVERYYRPSILFSIDTEKAMAHGSGRSIPGLNMVEVLQRCNDVIERFGGHSAAAGLTVRLDKLDEFRRRFSDEVQARVSPEDLIPKIEADAEVSFQNLTPSLVQTFKRMEPFGPGNMRPVLLCRRVGHHFPPRCVGTNHIKMMLTESNRRMDAIAFNFAHRLEEIEGADTFSVAFGLDENEWNGKINLQMKVKGVEI
jgi:single-stranded-DNA-specific exonuclease